MRRVKDIFDKWIARDKVCGFAYLESAEEQRYAKDYLESLGYDVVTGDHRFYTRYQVKPENCMEVTIYTKDKVKELIQKYFSNVEFEETPLERNKWNYFRFEIKNCNGEVIAHGDLGHSLMLDRPEDRRYSFQMYMAFKSATSSTRYVSLTDFENDLRELSNHMQDKVFKFV